MKKILLFFFVLSNINAIAQNELVFSKAGIKANRTKLYQNIVTKVITPNLSLPLEDSTEENWQSTFWAMEFTQYKSPWVSGKITGAVNVIQSRSIDFQRALLELIYTNFKKNYVTQITNLANNTADAKTFVLCINYLLQANSLANNKIKLNNLLSNRKVALTKTVKDSVLLKQCKELSLDVVLPKIETSILFKSIFSNSFLSGNTILYSIQRKNRDYPGIAIVKKEDGTFVTNKDGTIFNTQQLSRSITNLPCYLTNGNTPQGIFRMTGFAVSESSFIGPTFNIQLEMPFETSIQHFLKDSTVTDSLWTIEKYQYLLPTPLKKYWPLYQTYYASEVGRTEIIAHGTTIDPTFYTGKSYYPHTPSLGCLCTKEIWSEKDGRRLQSNQQKLVDALQKAENIDGYCIVIEIDDEQKPVNLNEISPYLKNK
jgi:hypothetical protein